MITVDTVKVLIELVGGSKSNAREYYSKVTAQYQAIFYQLLKSDDCFIGILPWSVVV